MQRIKSVFNLLAAISIIAAVILLAGCSSTTEQPLSSPTPTNAEPQIVRTNRFTPPPSALPRTPTSTPNAELFVDSTPEKAAVYILPGGFDDYQGFEDLTQDIYLRGMTPLTTDLSAKDSLVVVVISKEQLESAGFEVPLLVSSFDSYFDVFYSDGNPSTSLDYEGVSSIPSSIAKVYPFSEDTPTSQTVISIFVPSDWDRFTSTFPFLYPSLDLLEGLPKKYAVDGDEVVRSTRASLDALSATDEANEGLFLEVVEVLSKVGKATLELPEGRLIIQMLQPGATGFSISTREYGSSSSSQAPIKPNNDNLTPPAISEQTVTSTMYLARELALLMFYPLLGADEYVMENTQADVISYAADLDILLTVDDMQRTRQGNSSVFNQVGSEIVEKFGERLSAVYWIQLNSTAGSIILLSADTSEGYSDLMRQSLRKQSLESAHIFVDQAVYVARGAGVEYEVIRTGEHLANSIDRAKTYDSRSTPNQLSEELSDWAIEAIQAVIVAG